LGDTEGASARTVFAQLPAQATASTPASIAAATLTTLATAQASTLASTSTAPTTLPPPVTVPRAQSAFSTKAVPTETTQYRNARIGYVLTVPTVLVPEPEFAGREGRMFRAPDGGVVLTVHGGLTQPGVKPWAGAEPGDKVTYFARLPGGWVKSGTRNDGKILWYARLRSDATSFAVFSISYPENARSIWNPAAGKINGSFSLV
jgi:hypothetical protein